MNTKLQTYLGFCIRSRKIVFGAEEAETQKKGVFLLMMDTAVGNSSQKCIKKAQEKFGCPLLVTPEGVLGELLHRPSVKAVAIKDEHLASAIVEAAKSEPELKLYSGGNNESYGKEV